MCFWNPGACNFMLLPIKMVSQDFFQEPIKSTNMAYFRPYDASIPIIAAALSMIDPTTKWAN